MQSWHFLQSIQAFKAHLFFSVSCLGSQGSWSCSKAPALCILIENPVYVQSSLMLWSRSDSQAPIAIWILPRQHGTSVFPAQNSIAAHPGGAHNMWIHVYTELWFSTGYSCAWVCVCVWTPLLHPLQFSSSASGTGSLRPKAEEIMCDQHIGFLKSAWSEII